MLLSEVEELPPDLPLLPWAEEEMRRTPEVERRIFVRRSEKVWVLLDEDHHTLAVAGVIVPTAVSTPELWILLCEGFKANLRRNLVELYDNMVSVLLEQYPHVRVKVDAQAPAGTKFAELFGFVEVGRQHAGDREYIHLEVRK